MSGASWASRGGLAQIMIDSGNLVGDVVSEEFAWQANLAGEPCQKEKETAAAAGKMQIIRRCYPVKLRIAGIGTPFEIQPWVVRGMKNAVNLGQLFLSRNSAHLTFTEGKVSLQIGGSEVYLEEKGYSGLDGRADRAPAAAGSYDRVPPEAREDRYRAPPEAQEGAWTALLSPQERERLLGRPRARGRGSPSHLRRPLSESDCVICPLEETFRHSRLGEGTGEPPRGETEGSPANREGNWRGVL